MKSCLFFLVVLACLGLGGVYAANRWNTVRLARNATLSAEKVVDYRVTVIEGKRREEIGRLLEGKGICTYADFMAASTDKEGTLFPDTYRLYKNTPALQVVATMTGNFEAKTAALRPTANQLNLAAIVEREAEGDADRALIAGIYTNRLSRGMALDADPTVQYAKESAAPRQTYWQPIIQDNYANVISPYNTYLHPGLPPAPIANPGLASIKAAISPTVTPYLYFLHKNGTLIPARTLAEQLSHE